MNSFSQNSQSESNTSENLQSENNIPENLQSGNNASENLQSKNSTDTFKVNESKNFQNNDQSTDSSYDKAAKSEKVKETTEKRGGFSAQALNEIAFKALTIYAENFLRENKDLDSEDKSLGTSYGDAAELILNSHNVSENVNNLEGLQDDTLQIIIGAKDSGNTVLKEVKDLSEFVLRITGSVKNINDIAERVHVLSLNAAIEAARAGERGKGFAVVSSEIRSLAGSTAQRVEEISEYIRQSSSTVDRLVTGTHTTVNSVSSTYDKLTAATNCRKDIAKFTLKIETDILEFRNVHLVESLRRRHSVLRVLVLKYLMKGELLLDKDDIPNSRHCPLGRWYRENRNTIRALSDVSIYRRLDEAHELFHSTITQLQKAVQYENQDQVIKLLNELETSNRQISDILIEVISVIKGSGNTADNTSLA